jgi:2,4-dienoyl-CoA reductase (NADPH2)
LPELSGIVHMSSMLRRTFSPIRINGLDVQNRILMSSMHLNYEGDDQFERLAKFYQLRARNGAGLIVTAGCSPDAAGRGKPNGFAIDDDHLIEGHRKIVSAVRAAGDSKLALQLLHVGREGLHGQLVAPSALRANGNLFAPEALSHEQILETVASFARAAERAVVAGYDAVEIVFSQGFLIHQFLSEHANQRSDEWGGDFERRLHFASAVAEAVRTAVGEDFPLIYRVPCLDLVAGGLSFEDSMALVRALEPHQIDLLNVGIGGHEANIPTIATSVPHAGFSSIAARVKRRFPHLPIAVSNRINDLRHAEELLIGGVADMVAMGRPFLADWQIVEKSRLGKFDDVRKCIACNQDCLDRVFRGEEVGCSLSPDCGTPAEGEAPPRFRSSPRIAVIGGGLSGMVCACTLAERGARVTLFERESRLGGQMLLASRIPGKADFHDVVRHFENRLLETDVTVHLNKAFDRSDCVSREWDHVVVATGTSPTIWDGRTGVGVRVMGYQALLEDDLPVEYPLVILGGGGVALDVAKFLLARQDRRSAAEAYLASHGAEKLAGPLEPLGTPHRDITILQRSTRKIGYKLGRTGRWVSVDELERKGVKFIRGVSVEESADAELSLRHVDGKISRVPARTIVVAIGHQSNALPLQHALTEAGLTYSVVGAACSSPESAASISSSIRSGYTCALELTLPVS